MSDAAFYLFLLLLIVFCAGDPDIIDGLAKRANNIECIAPPSRPETRDEAVPPSHPELQEEVEFGAKPDPLQAARGDVSMGEAL